MNLSLHFFVASWLRGKAFVKRRYSSIAHEEHYEDAK
jgi:hypothetical protein